jgi:hypothetical protein
MGMTGIAESADSHQNVHGTPSDVDFARMPRSKQSS